MLCSIIWQVLQLEYSLTCFKSYFNKWKKLSIGIDFGYRPKFMVSVSVSVSTKKASIAHHYQNGGDCSRQLVFTSFHLPN